MPSTFQQVCDWTASNPEAHAWYDQKSMATRLQHTTSGDESVILSAIFESDGSAEEFCRARLLELREKDDNITRVAQAVGRQICLSDVEWTDMGFVHRAGTVTIPKPSRDLFTHHTISIP